MSESQQTSPQELKDQEAVEQLKNDPSKLQEAKNQPPSADEAFLDDSSKEVLRKAREQVAQSIKIVRDTGASLKSRIVHASALLTEIMYYDKPLGEDVFRTPALSTKSSGSLLAQSDVRIAIFEEMMSANITTGELKNILVELSKQLRDLADKTDRFLEEVRYMELKRSLDARLRSSEGNAVVAEGATTEAYELLIGGEVKRILIMKSVFAFDSERVGSFIEAGKVNGGTYVESQGRHVLVFSDMSILPAIVEAAMDTAMRTGEFGDARAAGLDSNMTRATSAGSQNVQG
jgi:hypothetical protein